MKETHFYSSKIVSFVMFVFSAIFTCGFIFMDIDRYSLFKIIMLKLGFVLFLFGLIYSLILLFRRKPLLTITDRQIIIYNMFRKQTIVDFEDIKSFYISNSAYRGIKTTESICIVLKPDKNKKSSKFSFYFHQAIQVDILNVKTKVLLRILNTKLKSLDK